MIKQEDTGIVKTMELDPATQNQQRSVIGEKEIAKAAATLKKYKAGKESLEKRITDNEQWYRLRHWDVMRSKYATGESANRPEPSSAWLFNALANKHADAMDNFPEPNVLPREKSDEEDAKSLTAIIPVVLERNDFEKTYSDAWWYKLKMGTAVYGNFWNSNLENGLGDIAIRKVDLLNIFWEPGITDIQKSRNLFIVDLVDNDILEAEYPKLKGKLAGKVIDVKEYVFDDTVDTAGKSVVVDWYYKIRIGARTILHYVKFVGNTLLYASENDPECAESGWYKHGEYPVVFDVLFPEEGTVYGFGYIDICKDPQMYIDKLNQIIIENALRAGRKRYFAKEDGNINLEDFADWSKPFIKVSGNLSGESIREVTETQLDGNITNLLTLKIEELKETSGNRDVNQGSSSGGVTAAAAIAALQEAGNKLSRDMIKASYRAYTKVNYLSIELIRQFYTVQRTFRIEGAMGKTYEYIDYSNKGIVPQDLPAAAEGLPPGSRVPIFDIKVKPQRSNPFSRMAQNELAKELYGMGLFRPDNMDQALITLDMMEFEGKEAVIDKLKVNKSLYDMVMELQQMLARLIGMEGGLEKSQAPVAETVGSNAMMKGINGATENANNAYGERLAKRAQVNVGGEQ